MKEREYANAQEQEAIEISEELMLLGLWSVIEVEGRLNHKDALGVISEISDFPIIMSIVCLVKLKEDGFITESKDEKGIILLLTESGVAITQRYKTKYPDKYKEFSAAVAAEKVKLQQADSLAAKVDQPE